MLVSSTTAPLALLYRWLWRHPRKRRPPYRTVHTVGPNAVSAAFSILGHLVLSIILQYASVLVPAPCLSLHTPVHYLLYSTVLCFVLIRFSIYTFMSLCLILKSSWCNHAFLERCSSAFFFSDCTCFVYLLFFWLCLHVYWPSLCTLMKSFGLALIKKFTQSFPSYISPRSTTWSLYIKTLSFSFPRCQILLNWTHLKDCDAILWGTKSYTLLLLLSPGFKNVYVCIQPG